MKKIKFLAVAALSTFTLGLLSACEFPFPNFGGNQPNTPDEPEKGFAWLVTEDQDREIGSIYNMAGIWGRYNGEYIQPTIAVSYNGAAAEFDAENKILPLYELGEYTITLTFNYKDEDEKAVTETKTFVVTSVDTTAPTVAKLKAERLFSGTEIDLNENFTAYDSVDEQNVTMDFEVKAPSGDNVTVTDNAFTANEYGYYTVTVTSKDSRNNTAVENFKMYVRDSKIFESFRFEDESEQKGYSVNGREFAITTEQAQGDGGCLYFMSYEKYNHAVVQFENSLGVKWSKTNGLIFTIYNASKSAVTLELGGLLVHEDIWGTNRALFDLKPKAYNTVFVSASELSRITTDGTEYLYAEVCYANNGGEFTTGQIELYFDDVIYASAEEAEAFATSLAAKEIASGFKQLELTTIENAAGETVEALHFTPAGTWERFYFTNSNAIKWSNVKTLTINVYNPMDVAVGFKFGADSTTLNATSTSQGAWGTQLVIVQPGWNTVTIDVSDFSDGDSLYVALATKETSFGNTADNYDNYKANGIYFAEMKASYYTWTEVPEDPEETGKDNVIDDNY